MMRSVRSHSESETASVAEKTIRDLGIENGTFFLYGELGAGKTAFVRGLARGIGSDPDEVSSPTFVLAQQYVGTTILHHVDLYRLTPEEVNEFEPQLLEMMSGQGLVAVEWADRLERPLSGVIHVRISDDGGDDRVISIETTDEVNLRSKSS